MRRRMFATAACAIAFLASGIVSIAQPAIGVAVSFQFIQGRVSAVNPELAMPLAWLASGEPCVIWERPVVLMECTSWEGSYGWQWRAPAAVLALFLVPPNEWRGPILALDGWEHVTWPMQYPDSCDWYRWLSDYEHACRGKLSESPGVMASRYLAWTLGLVPPPPTETRPLVCVDVCHLSPPPSPVPPGHTLPDPHVPDVPQMPDTPVAPTVPDVELDSRHWPETIPEAPSTPDPPSRPQLASPPAVEVRNVIAALPDQTDRAGTEELPPESSPSSGGTTPPLDGRRLIPDSVASLPGLVHHALPKVEPDCVLSEADLGPVTK